ncbi:MAG: hypothetical protein R3301_08705 [Saprospiraceae bacterium]|nr:hypothetical protein [Saprospiraceae bacterium]
MRSGVIKTVTNGQNGSSGEITDSESRQDVRFYDIVITRTTPSHVPAVGDPVTYEQNSSGTVTSITDDWRTSY